MSKRKNFKAFKNNSFINQKLSGIKSTITKHDQRPQLISTLNMVYKLNEVYIFNLKEKKSNSTEFCKATNICLYTEQNLG